jgi:uncharacterized membrane protein YgdD (TMEM256/DUF423 family)
MKPLTAVAQEVLGLFMDDGSLALGILIVVALAAISEILMAATPIVGGTILIFGCLCLLFVNVLRAGQD